LAHHELADEIKDGLLDKTNLLIIASLSEKHRFLSGTLRQAAVLMDIFELNLVPLADNLDVYLVD